MATEKRLIDANALIVPEYDETGDPFIKGFHQGKIDAIIEVKALAPTVDAVEVVHGRWVCLEAEIGLYECSECGHRILRAECNYCPNCGAKMDLRGGMADDL